MANKNNASLYYPSPFHHNHLLYVFSHVFYIEEYTLKTYFFATAPPGKGDAPLNWAFQMAFMLG